MERPDDIFDFNCGQKQALVKAQVIKELSEARADLFQYKIDAGLEKTIALIQKITPIARGLNKEKELNEITASLMDAMKKKDYLLFSDIAFYEISTLFDR